MLAQHQMLGRLELAFSLQPISQIAPAGRAIVLPVHVSEMLDFRATDWSHFQGCHFQVGFGIGGVTGFRQLLLPPIHSLMPQRGGGRTARLRKLAFRSAEIFFSSSLTGGR